MSDEKQLEALGNAALGADVGKKWWTSKTLWVNAITLAVAVVAAVVDSEMLPAKYVALATSIVLPLLNMALRVVTGQPLALPPSVK